MLLVTLVLSVLIGVSLGVLGGGGSILTVPILVYVAGMGAKPAIATSLFVVGVTSAAGAIGHARAGRVQWRTGLVFGMAGMAGAYAGGRVAQFIPGWILLVGFALMMLATAVAMLRPRKAAAAKTAELATRPAPDHLPVLKVVAEGVVVGLVTGLVGAGGGFLVVPALALLGGLPMNIAVGTSLVVIAMKSGAGFLGYLHSVPIDWPLALGVSGAAVAGSFIGGRLVGRLSEQALRKSFGWFVLAMAVLMLGKQAPAGWLSGTTGWVIAGVGAVAAIGVVLARRLRPRVQGDVSEIVAATPGELLEDPGPAE